MALADCLTVVSILNQMCGDQAVLMDEVVESRDLFADLFFFSDQQTPRLLI